MRVGIFGGTFDPPHVGHLILADEACAQLRLDRLLWVLTADPPHKQGKRILPVAQRLDLLQAALQDNPNFELSRVDIDRPPPHYAVGTLGAVRAQFPQAELWYLMGGDSLRDLPTWHRPADFVAACDGIGVMRRPGADMDLAKLEQQISGLSAKLEWVNAPLLEISASHVRQMAAEGGPFRYYLPPAVYEIIVRERLYQKK